MPTMDIYERRRKWFEEGQERWRELTKDWSEEDRDWAASFWSEAGQPWG